MSFIQNLSSTFERLRFELLITMEKHPSPSVRPTIQSAVGSGLAPSDGIIKNFNHPTMGQPTSHTSLCGISPGHSSHLLEPSRFQCVPFGDTSAPPPPKRRSYPPWNTPSHSARNRWCGLAPASSPPACPLRGRGHPALTGLPFWLLPPFKEGGGTCPQGAHPLVG